MGKIKLKYENLLSALNRLIADQISFRIPKYYKIIKKYAEQLCPSQE